MKFLLTIFIVFLGTSTFAQQNAETQRYLEELFSSGRTFEEITSEADQYFKQLYPNFTNYELCEGEHRDGDFVKYQRWNSYWKNHLNENGTIGPLNNIVQTRGLDETQACTGDEFIASWNNINYASNMGYQIDQGRTNCITFHPTDSNTWYVGAAFGGLWKTTDGGQSYNNLNDDLPILAVSGIVIDPNDTDHILISLSDIVWYGPYGLGVYESTDGGVSFSPTSLVWDVTDFDKIYYMEQDPNNPGTIIIASNVGLYKTTDFFATNTQVLGNHTRSVKFSRSDASIVYAGGDNGQFYRSTDGGDSFSLITDFGNGQVRIAVPNDTNSQNMVVTHGTYLQRSTNDGLTFTQLDLPENNMVVEFHPSSENILLVGNFEVYRSDDFGSNFTDITHWLGNNGLPYIHVDQRNVFINPYQGNSVYFCNDGGISTYNFNNDSFSNHSSGLIITQYYDIAVSQSEDLVLGGGSQDNGNVFRASNGTWDQYAQTGDGMGQEIDPTNADIRYWSYQNGGLRKWNNGSNSNIAPPGKNGNGAWETPFKLDPSNSNRLFVGYDTVYVSDDQGDNWTNVGGLVNSGNLDQLAIAPTNSDHLYATKSSVLYEKNGVSGSWTLKPTPFLENITDLEVDPFDEDVIYISYSGYTDGKKVYRSDDGGDNWTDLSLNLPNLPIMSLELYNNEPGGVFVGTYGAVYYMDNSQTEWRKYGCIPNTSVNDIEIQYQTEQIYIGTHGRGIFHADINFNLANTDSEEINNVQQLILYPNPTTNFVFIQGQIGNIESFEVELFDLLGKQLKVPYTLNGLGEIALDCSKLNNGNYIIKVKTNESEEVTYKITKI